MLIGRCEVITPIDFEFTRSKGKVTRVTFVKKCVNMDFAHYLENWLSRAFIFHMPIGLDDNTSLDNFKFSRSKAKDIWSRLRSTM